ncbi:MAG: GNAT family N-acetyltransferase, partial [Bacteroidota bacterium]
MQTVHIIHGSHALQLIGDSNFLEEWHELADHTPGFSTLQEPDFVLSWYKQYSDLFQVVLAFSKDEEGVLRALVPLALHKADGYLTHAGSYYAEYHGWLARPEDTQEFFSKFLPQLKAEFPLKKWEWQWIPPHISFKELLSLDLKDMGIYLDFVNQETPEWNLLDEAKLKKTWKSSSLKSKIRRLKKRGEYKFELIEDPQRLYEVLQIAQYQCDFRKEAVNNVRPFADDPRNIDFSQTIMERSAGLHNSALWLDDQLLAFHSGTTDGERVCLGMICFDPTEFKSSPGTILIAELARNLSETGYQTFDITPGKDGYKNRYANQYTSLRKPLIYFSRSAYLKAQVSKQIKGIVETVLDRYFPKIVGLPHLKKISQDHLARLKEIRPSNLISIISSRFFRKMVFQIYRINNLSIEKGPNFSEAVKKQCYRDLMLYDDKFPHLSRRSLLIEAMDKFKAQEKLYSLSDDGVLLSYAWLKQTKDASTMFETHIPAGAFIFHDFYVRECQTGQSSFTHLIECMLHDASQDAKRQIYIVVRKNSHFVPSLLKKERLHSMIEVSKVFIFTALTSKRRTLQSF